MTERKPKSILIVEVNWVGDVLFSTPAIRALRKKFQKSHIACMIVPSCKDVIEGNPNIDELIIYDEKGEHKGLLGKVRFITDLRKKNFDLAILFHRSFTRRLLTYMGGARERVGYSIKKGKFLLTAPVKLPARPIHKVDHFLRIVEALGCEMTEKTCELFIGSEDVRYVDEELSKLGITGDDTIVVLNPGGNWPPKRWPPENFARLADALIKDYGVKVIISGADKDLREAFYIKEKMSEQPVIFCGKTSLKQLAALMKKADFVISGDTGPMHIAVAMKSNVIALFGPTSPSLTGPSGKGNYKVLQKKNVCETPCYQSSCSDFKCMQSISVSEIIREFERMFRAYVKNR